MITNNLFYRFKNVFRALRVYERSLGIDLKAGQLPPMADNDCKRVNSPRGRKVSIANASATHCGC